MQSAEKTREWMSRPNNDQITERGRRFTERQQRQEAFQQAAEEIRQDRSFPRVLQRVAEEALRFQNQQFSDEGSSLTSLREEESILQTLAEGDGDSEAFSALESESDSEQSVQSNYKSSHDTPDNPEDDELDGSSTPEPTEELPLEPRDRQSLNKTKRTPTPPPEKERERTPAEKVRERAPTPPAEKVRERAPTPPAEKVKDCTPSPPPTEQEKEHTPPEQTFEDYTMPYRYPKYRDDPNAEAHVYAFLQTWEANHVSQRLIEPEAKLSKIVEFGITLEGPVGPLARKASTWKLCHIRGLETKFLRLFHRQVEQRELVSQFYTTHQEEQETVPQFIIRFQTLHNQLTRAPPEDEAKVVFLAVLQEPFRTMCVVLDIQTSTMDQVIDRVLEMDKHNSFMSLGALHCALPKEEDLRFQQALQCTTCQNLGHLCLNRSIAQ